MRGAWLGAATLLVLIAGGAEGADAPVTVERSSGAYVARIIGHPDRADGSRLEIRQSGKVVLARTASYFEFPEAPPMGADVTGTGMPFLVVTVYSGGAHCCYEDWLLALGPSLRLVDRLPGDNAPGEFAERDGRWLYGVYDWTFSYWNESFADSSACKVWLGYREGKWRPVPETLRRPPYAQAKLDELAKAVRTSGEWKIVRNTVKDYAPRLWTVMLELVYTGNPDQALTFLDLAWPPAASAKAKAAVRRDFAAQLRRSPYYRDIAALPHLPLRPQDPKAEPVCSGPS